MSDLFNYAAGKALRDRGLEAVSSFPNDQYLKQARALALILAAKNGEVTTDDVQRILPRPENIHPNVVGAICKCKELKFVGFKQSERATAHARRIGIYRLADHS